MRYLRKHSIYATQNHGEVNTLFLYNEERSVFLIEYMKNILKC